MENSNELIKNYWNERAKIASTKQDSPQATTDDIYLRVLESNTLSAAISSIKKDDLKILDIGCGDGLTTCELLKNKKVQSVMGVDFSAEMIEIANRRKVHLQSEKILFKVGDVLKLNPDSLGYFDLVITNRCLINLENWEDQKLAINNIYQLLNKGGAYFATENFINGHNNMNKLRKSIQLSEIPVRWHNYFYDESKYFEYVNSLFHEVEIDNFASSYYFITRSVYSKYAEVTGLPIDYNHKLHEIAVNFPTFGDFSPLKFIKHVK